MVCCWALSTSLSGAAGLPARDAVFTIGIFTPADRNLVSRDYIFSALPHYEEVDRATVRDYPSHKTSWSQQGAIVLNDKTVLFFETRSAKYLSVVDSSNHSTFYQLKGPLPVKLTCPRPEKDLADLPLPDAADVFCIAMFPWNQGDHFTPESLAAALPGFRLLTEADVPNLAVRSIEAETNRTLYSPAEWTTPAGRRAEVLNGVIVLKNRAVFQWITWTPTAIAFRNHQQGSYYVIDRK